MQKPTKFASKVRINVSEYSLYSPCVLLPCLAIALVITEAKFVYLCQTPLVAWQKRKVEKHKFS